jgi:hypothetical protein
VNPFMAAAEHELKTLVAGNPITKGMIVRVSGSHLYLAREEPPGPFSTGEADDRVRFTRLGKSPGFGLSVLRHTGTWEKVPFSGSLAELVEIVCTAMQHLIAADP